MIRSQADYLSTAARVQEEKDRRHMLERTRDVAVTIFPPGTWVKAMHPPSTFGWRAPNKLAAPWRGPYQVLSRSKGQYELRDPALPDTLWISEHLLEIYNVDKDHSTPVQVAIDDRNMSFIEKVIDVKGFWKKRSSILLFIKWADETTPQWYPWNSTFLHNEHVHDFFMKKGGPWKSLVPKNYREQFEQRTTEGILTADVDATVH